MCATTRALCEAASGSGGGSADTSWRPSASMRHGGRCARLVRSLTREWRVEGKVVLITGGAKRVGAAICRRVHAAGANLMLHYRASAGEARLLQAELNHQRKDSVALIQADLLDLAKLQSLVDQTVQRFGRLDALVNNASSFHPTPVGQITSAVWDDLMGTNLRAPLFLAQAAASAL